MKPIVSMIVFVMILGSVLTAALVWVDRLTAPLIAKNEQRKVSRGVLDALGIPFKEENLDTTFGDNISVRTIEGVPFYTSGEGRLAFQVNGSGLWGPINGVVALEPDRKTIRGITVIHQEETPGLGGRIGEPEYLERFKQKSIVPEIKIVGEGKAATSNEVDGITGATLSCNAFEAILNAEAGKSLALLSKGGK